jgi:hypothetical protein
VQQRSQYGTGLLFSYKTSSGYRAAIAQSLIHNQIKTDGHADKYAIRDTRIATTAPAPALSEVNCATRIISEW